MGVGCRHTARGQRRQCPRLCPSPSSCSAGSLPSPFSALSDPFHTSSESPGPDPRPTDDPSPSRCVCGVRTKAPDPLPAARLRGYARLRGVLLPAPFGCSGLHGPAGLGSSGRFVKDILNSHSQPGRAGWGEGGAGADWWNTHLCRFTCAAGKGVSVRGPSGAAAGRTDTGEGPLGAELGVDSDGVGQAPVKPGRSRRAGGREPAASPSGPGVLLPLWPELKRRGLGDELREPEPPVETQTSVQGGCER